MKKRLQKSSGNVFADIGTKNPEEALIKARLAHAIMLAIKAKELSQIEAAQMLGIDQPKASNLVRGKIMGFSMDRLFRYLTILGVDIENFMKDSSRTGNRPGRMKVAVA